MPVTLNLWLNDGRDTERVDIDPATVRAVAEIERPRRRLGAVARLAVVVLHDGRRFECFDGDRTVKARLGR